MTDSNRDNNTMTTAAKIVTCVEDAGGSIDLDLSTGEPCIHVDRMKLLPPEIQSMVAKHQKLICAHLVAQQTPALLLEQMGVSAKLITTVAEARETAGWLVEDETARRSARDSLPKGSGLTGIDIETTGLDPHEDLIRTVQIWPTGSSVAYVFDLLEIDDNTAIADLWKLQGLVAHNASFEQRFIDRRFISPPPKIRCTMQAAGLIYGDNFLSLSVLAEGDLGLIVPKAEQLSDWSADTLTADQIAYAAADAVLAVKLMATLEQKISAKNSGHVMSAMTRAAPTVAVMVNAGIHIDADRHAALQAQWQTDYDAAMSAWAKAWPKVDPTKPSSLEKWIVEQIGKDGVSAWPRTKEDRLSVAAGVLKENGACLPGIEYVLQIRKSLKFLSTYGTNFVNHAHPTTGAIHSNLVVAGARTGRFSSSKPNMQNPPRTADFRRIFCPSGDAKFVVADWSCMEVRAVAEECRDPAMLEVFRQGFDFHRATVERMTGVPSDEVTREQRQGAKALAFGLLYGMGEATLSDYAHQSYGVAWTLTEAKQKRNAFFRAYPALKLWQRNQANRVRQNGMFARNRYGRTVECTKAIKDGGPFHYTRALNVPIQGSCAEVLLETLAALPAAMADLDAVPVACVHDEIVLEVGPGDADEAAALLDEVMTKAFLKVYPGHQHCGLVDVAIGDDWAAAKH